MNTLSVISTAMLSGLVLAACNIASAPISEAPNGDANPKRIVSLDYCADQFVLKFADRESILAVSPDAAKSFSYMRAAAAGIPTVRSSAEDVLLLKPDLIVRAYGGGPNAKAFFERAGIRVVDVGWAGDITGVKRLNQDMANALGAPDAGRAVVADMEARLAAMKTASGNPKALYVTPGGVTSGPGSLVHEMMLAAGLTNFQERQGWGDLPLERMAYERPDMIAAASFENAQNEWSAAAHPIARAQAGSLPTANLEGAWTTCGGWFLVDAIEAMAEAGRQIGGGNAP